MARTIQEIPVDKVQPFAGQPRRYFDPAALRELADSIAAHGQSTPAWVVPLQNGRYELVAGERRWRACQLAGIPTLLCEIRKGMNREQQYLASVMENFGRKDCTTMETVQSVGRMLEMYDGDLARTAAVFARSTAWVQQYRMLLRLEPEVAAMLEPPEPKLTTLVAVSLANLQPEVQVRLAREIAKQGLKHRSALSHIRSSVTDDARVVRRGRKRRPSDDFRLLTRLLGSIGPQAQAVLDLGDARLAELFVHREPKVVDSVRAVLVKRIEQLRSLERSLGRVKR